MKKKIKDLTFFDLNEICSKNANCDDCPMFIVYKGGRRACIVEQLENSPQWDRIIDQEVEI